MSEFSLLTETPWQPVATTLLHFLWQGLVVAGILALALRLFPKASAEDRYLLCLLALLTLLACPVVTFVQLDHPDVRERAAVAEVEPVESAPVVFGRTVDSEFRTGTLLVDESNFELSPSLVGLESEADRLAPTAAVELEVAEPARTYHWWIVAAWLAGVAVLSVRLCLEYVSTFVVCWGREPVGGELGQRIGRLAECVGLRRVPRVCVSSRVRQAIVVGYLRPMVLLPVSWVMQLPPEVLDAVIAHELAHIRRFDLWAILLQRVAETLLFYHPAVWWLSRRLSREREFCCDLRAAAAAGSTSEYAAALEQVARQQSAGRTPALLPTIGGRKMELLERIERVMAADCSQRRRTPRWSGVGVGVLLLGVAVVVGGRFVAAGDVLEAVETSSEVTVEQQGDVTNGGESDDGQPKPLVQLSQVKGVIPDDFVVARVNGEEILMERLRLEGGSRVSLVGLRELPRFPRWLTMNEKGLPIGERTWNLKPDAFRWRQEEGLRRSLALSIERILFAQHVRKTFPDKRSWELVERQIIAEFERELRRMYQPLGIEFGKTAPPAERRKQLDAKLRGRNTSLHAMRQWFEDVRVAALGIDPAWLELNDTARTQAYLNKAHELASDAKIETALDDWDGPRGRATEQGPAPRPVVLSEVEGPLTAEHTVAVIGGEAIGADLIFLSAWDEWHCWLV